MRLNQRTATVLELVPLLFVDDIVQSLGFYCDQMGFESPTQG